jgi:hypothetical protein
VIVVRIVKYWMRIVRSGDNETEKFWFLLGIWRLKYLGVTDVEKWPISCKEEDPVHIVLKYYETKL